MSDTKNNIVNIYPLTSMQEGMLFHSIHSDNSGVYTEQTIFDVKGDLDIKVFEETFNCLIEKYDIFRTAFVYNKLDTPKQVVLKSRKINVEVLDLQHMESDDVEDKLQELLKEDKIKGFDLEKDTLLRLTILALSENRYKIVWSFHHIIMDGWCIGLLLKDIVSIYEKLISNKRVENVQGYNYGQYIKWLQKQDLNTALDSWKEYLKDFDKASILIENANKNDGYEHKECKIDLNLSHLQKVRELTRKYGITESTFFQTVWGILLQKFNNTEDAIFGTVVSGRTANLPHIEDIIGLFINTLPLRVKGDSSLSFIQLAKNVQDKFNDVRKYEYTPLTSIQKVSEENQNLINSLFVYENYPISDLLSELKRENKLGFIIENIHSIEQTSYDFNIIINPNNEMPVEFKYNENIYPQEIVAVISETLIKIISQVTENVDILLKDIEIVPQSMIENIDRHMNFENSNYPTDICISELFEKMVEKFPTRIATIYGEDEITYEELNRRANKVARKLRQFNILNDEIVGIMLDRSIDMVVSIIGVLKAGGAYMPIDVDYPEDRKQYMVDDSKTRIIITEEKYLKEVQWDNDTIYLSRVIESNIDDTNIKCINSQSDLAYIIYTSGSSGKPKGTMIEHKNVIRLLFNSDFMFDFDENDVWTLAHSFCFDFSVWEMYGALLNGGKLVLLPKKVTISPERLVEVLEEQKVTVLNQTPVSFYGIIDEAIKRDSDISLKYVIFGGEALTPIKLKPWRSKYPETHLINMYGITETTVHVTYKEILEEDIDKDVSNIGKPIPTLSVYILDKHRKRLPINVAGEICVAGDGVCRGYLNRTELTSEKFIDNPFGNKSKLYCSGDLGRILPNGEIEYMGRIDNQVKIRGFRIELGEIEAKLRENINIREAIVLPKKTNNVNTLYAYIISNDKPDITEIRSFLAEGLPYYMIPSYFIEITEIPYTSNRKIDRKKLLAMDSVIESNKAFEEGNNSVEEIMIDIWKNVLSHSKVGRNDNFFELGGDSIKAIQVVSRLKKYNLSLDVKMLMKNPILSEVSKYVKEDKSTISQGEVTGNILLTPIQMEFLNNNVEVNKFNHAITVETKEKLDNSLIKEMFEILVKHHDALRMKYSYDGKEFLQNNEPYKEGLFNFSSVDISNYSDYESENIIKDVLDEKNEIINITDGLLMSVTVFHGREKSYISIIVHHMVIDGVSWRILLEDIENIFVDLQKKNKVNLPKKTTSFKQWANELNSYAQTNEVKKECEYWNGVVSGDKGSNKETVNYECDMKKVSAALSKDKTDKLLYEVNSKYGTEINDILLVALGRAIQSWEDCDRTVVSLEGHGRNYNFQSVDISNTIGWFTINYPIILKSYKDKDLSYEIRDVKEMLIKIPNVGLNYCLLKYLTKEGNIEFKEYTPKYSFNYMGQYTEKKESVFSKSDMPIGKTIGDKNITMFDIDINSVVEKEKFIITFRFNENKYKEESVQSLAKIYIESLENIIEHCIAKTEKMLSPSDLCYAELSIDEFDDLLEDLELLEV